MEFFQPHRKLEVVSITFSDTNVTPRIEAPALSFYFGKRRHSAKSRYIRILSAREVLLHQLRSTGVSLYILVPVQPDNIGYELNLFGSEIPVSSVKLPENVPCVDEENFAFLFYLGFSTVQEPEG